jgi:hypothetical protein
VNYLAHIKKPSPIHSLWRKQNLYKANLQGVLFTFNKRLQRYEAAGPTGESLEALVRNPHVHVNITTEAISEVIVTTPTVSEDPIQDLKPKDAEASAIVPNEPEGPASVGS